MKRTVLATSAAACFCLGLSAPALAAQAPAPTPAPSAADSATAPTGTTVSTTKLAGKCQTDLSAFETQMGKDGYWLNGSPDGYGYPVGGAGYGYGYPMMTGPAITGGYQNARPGYEVRMLVASANVLARHNQQQSCEDVLASTRAIYKTYLADMQSGKVPRADIPAWQLQQIASAQPVADRTTSFRSDELLGTDVRDPQNNDLGSVNDLVMSPTTGKIAYLVIGRGGIFGIGEKYVAVPWEDFKATPSVNLLVLDTTDAALNGAPQASNDKFASAGQFDQQSQKVDAYWKTQLPNGAGGKTSG